MKNNVKNNYSSMSKEELISLLLNSEKDNQKLTEKVNSLTKEKDELQKKFDNLMLSLKRARLERFVTESDNAFMTKQEKRAYSRNKLCSTSKKDKKQKKTKPKRTYTRDDLEKLSKGNTVIFNDKLPELQKEHPDWEFIKIGEDISYILELVKAHVVVHKVVTPKYKTKEDRNQIFQNLSVAPIPHSYVGASLLADICTAKFQFGMPVFRYYNWLKQCGFEIPMRSLYGYLMKAADILEPIYKEIEKTIKTGNPSYIGIDETYLKVIDEIGNDREHCYVYVLQCETEGRKIHFFHYTGSRSSEYVKKLLADYSGQIVVDGYSGYDNMPNGIKIQRCMCHLRRKFADIAKVLNDEQKKESAAYQAIIKIDKIFALEEDIKNKDLSPMEILEERNSPEYLSVVDDFKNYLSNLSYDEGSSLGKAVKYYLNGGDSFFTFLECGEIPIHNNETEQSCKVFASNRRCFLFCKSEEGAQAASTLTTIIKTAAANGLNPDKYLTYIFSHQTDKMTSELLPWLDEIKNNPEISIKPKTSQN